MEFLFISGIATCLTLQNVTFKVTSRVLRSLSGYHEGYKRNTSGGKVLSSYTFPGTHPWNSPPAAAAMVAGDVVLGVMF